MSEDHRSLGELEHAVHSAPNDHDLRGRLIVALLDAGNIELAYDHFTTLLQALPHEAWVMELGVDVASARGDHLQVARFRKQLRSVPDGDDIDDSPVPSMHPAHPSRDAASGSWPRLRLLPGGGHAEITAVGVEPRRRLDDIKGLATVKRNLVSIIESARDVAVPGEGPWLGGFLFYGPPSCGKAFSAEVVAGELGASYWFIDFDIAWDRGSLNDTIRRAIEASTDRPVVLFFDNLDTNDGERGSSLLEPMLPLLDGARKHGRVVVLSAATFPWHVSTRIVRPGRLGRVLLVLPPDGPARRMFLEERFNGRTKVSPENIDWLIAHTEGYSFGDLDLLVDVAIAIEASMEENVGMPTLTSGSLRRARQQVPPSSAEWLTTAGHHALMNESAGLYDDLLEYFRHRQQSGV